MSGILGTFVRSNAHARGHPEGGGNGGQNGDGDMQNLLPNFVLVHSTFSFSLLKFRICET